MREEWSLFDPYDVPLLQTSFGADFTRAYEEYEKTVIPLERTGARDVWNIICRAQQESGTPFIMYQDNINGTCRSHSSSTQTISHIDSQEQP